MPGIAFIASSEYVRWGGSEYLWAAAQAGSQACPSWWETSLSPKKLLKQN